MEEQDIMAQNETADVTADVSTPDTENEVQEDSSSSTEQEEVISSQQQNNSEEQKPRAQRRIEQLSNELKEAKQSVAKAQEAMNPLTPSFFKKENAQPLITDEDVQNGAIDPNVLEQRIAQRMQHERESLLVQLRTENRIRDEIVSHDSDITEVAKMPEFDEKSPQYDAELLKTVKDEYISLNMNGEHFVPRVKMSEIYNKYKKIISRYGAIASSNVQSEMSSISDGKAISNSATGTSNEMDIATQVRNANGNLDVIAGVLKDLDRERVKR